MSMILEFAEWLQLDEMRRFGMAQAASGSEARQAGRNANEIVTCLLRKKLECKIRDFPPFSAQDLQGIDAYFIDGPYAKQDLQIQARASHAARDDFAIALGDKRQNPNSYLGKKITEIIQPDPNAKHLTKWHQKTHVHALMSADDNMIYLAKWPDLEEAAMKAFKNWEEEHNNIVALTIAMPKPQGQDDQEEAGAIVPEGHQEKDPNKLKGPVSITLEAIVDGKSITANANVEIFPDENSTIQSIKEGVEKAIGQGTVTFVKKVSLPFRLRYIIKFRDGVDVIGEPVWHKIRYENDEALPGLKLYFDAPHGNKGTFNSVRDAFIDPETQITVKLTRSTQGPRNNTFDVYNPMIFIPANSIPTQKIPITKEEIHDCEFPPQAQVDTRNDMEKAEDEAHEKGEGIVKIMSSNPKNIADKQQEIEKFAARNNLNVSWPEQKVISKDKKTGKEKIEKGKTAIYTPKA